MLTRKKKEVDLISLLTTSEAWDYLPLPQMKLLTSIIGRRCGYDIGTQKMNLIEVTENYDLLGSPDYDQCKKKT